MKVVVWDRTATNSFVAAISFIKEDSLQNATKVAAEVFAMLNAIAISPGKFPLDKYKKANDGSFRALARAIEGQLQS